MFLKIWLSLAALVVITICASAYATVGNDQAYECAAEVVLAHTVMRQNGTFAICRCESSNGQTYWVDMSICRRLMGAPLVK